MALYTVTVTDFGGDVIPGLRVWVDADRASFHAGGVSFQKRVYSTVSVNGGAYFDLPPTVSTKPRVRYFLGGLFANGREMDSIEFVAQAGGGAIQAPESVAAPPGSIMFGHGPYNPPRGTIYLDLAAPGDKVNIHGEPGAVIS